MEQYLKCNCCGAIDNFTFLENYLFEDDAIWICNNCNAYHNDTTGWGMPARFSFFEYAKKC